MLGTRLSSGANGLVLTSEMGFNTVDAILQDHAIPTDGRPTLETFPKQTGVARNRTGTAATSRSKGHRLDPNLPTARPRWRA